MSEKSPDKKTFDEYIKTLEENLPVVKKELSKYPEREITLLAATKTVPYEVINYAIDNLGIRDIGENRVQELLEKYEHIHRDNVNIHFIGRLQTNKVKYIIDKVTLIHSVDSQRLAAEIDRQAKKHGKVMDILIEVNVGREASKGGIMPEAVSEFADYLAELENVRVVGIMAIPPAFSSSEETLKYFNETYKIFVDISQKKLHNIGRYVLSMGMSDSYAAALACGSNLVRLGSLLFGKRHYPDKPCQEG